MPARSSAERGPWMRMPGTSRGSISRAYAVSIRSCVAHALHAQRRQVVERGAQADGGGDVRRARLELVGHVVERRVPQVDLADHLAAAHERRHGLQELPARPERAGAGRAEHLVAGEDVEVGAEVLDVDGPWGTRLGAVDEHQGAGRVGLAHHLPDRVDGAQRVRHVGEGDQLGPRAQQHLEGLAGRGGPARRRRTNSRSASFSWTSSCQGTRLEWCSSSVSTIVSARPMLRRPQV